MGHDAGEVGTPYDHQLKPSHAAVEGQPEPEEDPREEEDTHGHGSVEHMLGTAPLIPHETMGQREKQTDAERDMD
ncbi:hypothetical protein C2E20_8121 [Micractinium conductrix]|uniref:Uncharacterized protein n=1 Tax=Micractinium conductrix TaxID=554055 RepID=A0A2P6V2E7_9CHLO|nr:hypothetical protein C2E20_8121 [Micractinium conductrix]|eukprot:PSC68260.1 hypothetical protein C2E20_8121 [Micractinium conductrix]